MIKNINKGLDSHADKDFKNKIIEELGEPKNWKRGHSVIKDECFKEWLSDLTEEAKLAKQSQFQFLNGKG